MQDMITRAIAVFTAVLLCLYAGRSTAGTTGKITGQVTDEGGNPVPGVAVVIEGTRRGTDTDVEGIYFLLSVEPGKHTLVASLVGYESHRKVDVLVSSDFTTNESFVLKENPIALGEIVVEAQAGSGAWGMFSAKANLPPVERDRTTSKYLVRGEDIEALPLVRTAEELIELQAGVTLDETGETLTLRAGDPGDVAYYLDGIPMPSSDHVRTRVYRNFNRLSVQELTVVTGGADAEYGNGQGGVVSVVTREGGQTYRGIVDYRFAPPGKKHWGENVYESNLHRGEVRWDDPAWAAETVSLPDGREVLAHRRQDYTGVWGHTLEGSLSGPLAKDLSFFFSSRWQREASTFPGPHLSTPFNTASLGKMTYRSSQNTKFRVGTLFDRRRGAFDPARLHFWQRQVTQSFDVLSSLIIGGRLDLRDRGRNLFLTDPAPTGNFADTDHLVYVGFTHLISDRTFYELRLSRSVSRRDTSGVRLPDGIAHISEGLTGDPVRDRAGVYTVFRERVGWDRFSRSRLMLKADLSSQIDRRHFLKTGLELIRFDNWYQTYFSPAPDVRIAGWYGKTYEDTDFFPGKRNRGVNPLQLGLYIQDKIELEGMVVNAGLRYDVLFQNTWVTDNRYAGINPDNSSYGFVDVEETLWRRMTRTRVMPGAKGPAIVAWSPRIGVSYPMGERSVLRFFYGQSSQFPGFAYLFFNSRSAEGPDRDLNGNGTVDPGERWNTMGEDGWGPWFTRGHNSNALAQEITTFEAGFDWNCAGDYTLGLTTYYRSENRQLRFRSIKNDNTLYADTRGTEFNLKKRFSSYFAFHFTFNLQWADFGEFDPTGTHTLVDSLFVARGHFWVDWDVDPATGTEVPVSLQEKARREGKPPDFYIREFGGKANEVIRKVEATIGDPLLVGKKGETYWVADGNYAAEGVERVSGERDRSFYSDQDRLYWEWVNRTAGYPGQGEGNLMRAQVTRASVGGPESKFQDRRSFGSLTLLFATPQEFGPLGGLRTNLVYRLFTGTPFSYTPLRPDPNVPGRLVGGVSETRYGPMHTRVDLNLEKVWGNPEDLNVALGVEVFNLFHQQDSRSTVSLESGLDIDFDPDRWQRWGIQGLRPDDANLLKFGEIFDVNNSWDSPRELRFSLRMKW